MVVLQLLLVFLEQMPLVVLELLVRTLVSIMPLVIMIQTRYMNFIFIYRIMWRR